MASEKYNKAVVGTTRRTSAEVVYELADTTAKEEAKFTVTDEETKVSRLNQMLNDVEEPTEYKFTTLERGYFKLNGSNRLTPKVNEYTNLELGWWTHTISNSNGIFTKPPKFIIDFATPHSSIGFTLTFDEEYPTQMIFYGYDLDNNLIGSMTVNNDDTKLIVEFPVENYTRIEIEFIKTRNPYRRIRFSEIYFGIIQRYRDKELTDFKLIREMSYLENNIPTSQVSFTIDNINKRFNIINPNGAYKYLQDKQMITTKIGVYIDDNTIEYIEMGKYYLDEWKTEGITATFVAKDNLFFVNDDLIYSNEEIQTKTLKEYAIMLLEYAGITNYIIDDNLSNITVTTTLINKKVKTLLTELLVVSGSVMYVDRNDNIIIKNIPIDTSHKIDLANMYEVPTIELADKFNSVYVEIFDTVNLTAGETININNMVVGDIERPYNIKDNPFITTNEIARNVGNFYLNALNNRLEYKVNWRQNPIIDIGDVVTIEDGFNTNKSMIITKQEFNYTGFLAGNTEGRGIN